METVENKKPEFKGLKVYAVPGRYELFGSRLKLGQESVVYAYKSPAGRKKLIDDRTMAKLRDAFLLDATDEEACGYAGISLSTLQKFQAGNQEFLRQKKAWKDTPVLRARKAVVGALDNDPDIALKYLERKRKDEFSTKTVSDVALKGQEYFERMRKDLGIDEESLEREAQAGE